MRSTSFRGVLLLLLSCALFTSAAAQTGPAAWTVGNTVPDVYGYDQNGELVSLHALESKNVIFEVSTAWCYPSFVLSAQVNAAKQHLESNGVPFEFITVIYQTPFASDLPIPLRSQGQAWVREFNSQTPVLSFFNGPIIPEKPPVMLAARWLLHAAGNAFPAVAIIGPDKVLRKLQTGALTADEIVAEFLPGQQPLPPSPVPPPAMAVKHATVTVKIGKEHGSRRDPFVVDSGPAFVVLPFERGSFPEDYTIAITKKAAPQQELWSIHFQGHTTPYPDVPGFPADTPIRIVLSNVHWDRAREPGILATPTARVRFFDNISSFNSAELDVPVHRKGGKVILGPFTVPHGGTRIYRMLTADILWHAREPSLTAAFQGDYLTLSFELPVETQDDWKAQLRAIEERAKTPAVDRKATLAAIDGLTRQIFRYKGPGLSSEGRGYLIKGLARIRAAVRQAR